MKVKATIEWTYEIDDNKLMEYYGTDFYKECIEIDKNNFAGLMWEEIIPDDAKLNLQVVRPDRPRVKLFFQHDE